MKKSIHGRGAQINVSNRFSAHSEEMRDDFLEFCFRESEHPTNPKTVYIDTFPKTIVNKVTSPDVGMDYSLNPYQGCEHGCIYCYARNSHEYWGYGPGLDFEQKILVKKNAPELLEKKLQSPFWKAATIVLSGNTDCYQPIEKKLKITRQLLQLFLRYKHPVGIITKNVLVTRDIDILQELAKNDLCRVIFSVTTLSEETRRLMEPRTATIKKRLEAIARLSSAGIPVMVMAGPMIPGINTHEILPLLKEVSERGALQVGYTIVRLNGAIGKIFEDWIRKVLPDRADKVLNQIADCHGGQLNDSRYGKRMKGEGNYAAYIHKQFEIGKQRYFKDKTLPTLNTGLFLKTDNGQLRLFNNL